MAYPSSINVYALNNSSLVRALPIASSSTEIQVTSYALSATNPSHLYAGTAQGILYHFDWVQGMKLGRWQVGAPIRSVTVTEDTLSRNNADLIYTRDSKSERWWMTAHRLQAVGGNVKPESGTILSLSNPITHSEVVDGGKIIVVASGRKLLVGASYVNTSQSLKELKYIWREVVTPLAITTLDVRVPGSSTSRKKSKQRGLSDVVVDVVIGDIDGVIHVFEDLHNSLVRREKQKDDPPTPRRMHWHRQVVHSVKWSRDGMNQQIIGVDYADCSSQATISSLVAPRRFSCCGSSTRTDVSSCRICRPRLTASLCRPVGRRTQCDYLTIR